VPWRAVTAWSRFSSKTDHVTAAADGKAITDVITT